MVEKSFIQMRKPFPHHLLNNFFFRRSLTLKNKIKKINKKNFLKKMLNKEGN